MGFYKALKELLDALVSDQPVWLKPEHPMRYNHIFNLLMIEHRNPMKRGKYQLLFWNTHPLKGYEPMARLIATADGKTGDTGWLNYVKDEEGYWCIPAIENKWLTLAESTKSSLLYAGEDYMHIHIPRIDEAHLPIPEPPKVIEIPTKYNWFELFQHGLHIPSVPPLPTEEEKTLDYYGLLTFRECGVFRMVFGLEYQESLSVLIYVKDKPVLKYGVHPTVETHYNSWVSGFTKRPERFMRLARKIMEEKKPYYIEDLADLFVEEFNASRFL